MSQRVDERPTMFDFCKRCGQPLRYFLPRTRCWIVYPDGHRAPDVTSVPRRDGLCESCARKLGLKRVPTLTWEEYKSMSFEEFLDLVDGPVVDVSLLSPTAVNV
ncbi:hypothetical protein CSTERTH_03790 [Thermoclostridium stercorarium subsp. thermolacticum DSM 2910]|jgi:hypothetical protein|uniref:Uncharacterized protein n=1 Tax=Thermoclostridium stercorarium subsp. thermolacticum DSM 2910 TaxID=1121336 RepID=A0A1B1YBR9_THEST|nr:hypothetical protein [Thermoclostridium stercorarium]ANW98220.1 hypothetical protein CSTERTH_03790 [Thermoclostridium stercorarium subsp. thermolacticum DSM 2910]